MKSLIKATVASIWSILTGKRWGEAQPPKQVRILGVIYLFHGIFYLAIATYILYMVSIPTKYEGVGTGPPPAGVAIIRGTIAFFAICFLMICFAFFLTSRSILRGDSSARKYGFALSTLTAVSGFFPVIELILLHFGLSPFVSIFILLLNPVVFLIWGFWEFIGLTSTVGATSLLCIYYLTRPQVKAFLVKERKRRKLLDHVRM